jgi:protein tyrosine kinase modulator
MASPLPTASIGLDQVLEILRRHRWLAAVVFLIPLAALVTLVLNLPEVYEASATLLVERQQVPPSYVQSTVTSDTEQRVRTITQSLLSRSQLVPMIEQFGLYPELRKTTPADRLVDRFIEGFRLTFTKNAPAFVVTFRGRDPRKVAAVANTLASRYIDEDLKIRERYAEGTATFLAKQLDQQLRSQLEDLETKVAAFKEKNMGELPSQEGANLATLDRLNGQLLVNEQRQLQLRGQIADTEKQLAASGAVEGDSLEAITARIGALRSQLDELLRHYTEKYPDVIRLKAEISQLEEHRQAMEAARASGESPPETASPPRATAPVQSGPLGTMRRELQFLEREEAKLKQDIAQYQQRVENAPRREQQFEALGRDYGTIQSVYTSLLQRYEEAKLAQNLEHYQKGEQFRILDPALVPDEPVAPNRPRLLFVSLVIALGLAGGAAFFAERLDTSFHSPDEFREAFHPQLMVTVHRIRTKADRRRELVRIGFGLASATVGLLAVIVISYLVARENAWLTSFIS